MTIKIRRVLFYGLTLTFFVVGAATVFYSNGWRFDWETFAISKLGAIYFKNLPPDSSVTIEKTNIKFEPGILKSGLYVANLFPKNYPAKVVKNGYQVWFKEISVKPSLVTEIPQIVLGPEKLIFEKPIAEKIADFWLGPEHFVLLNQDGNLLFNGKKIAGQEILSWSADGKSALTKGGNNYFAVDLNNLSKSALAGQAVNLSLTFNNLRKNLGKKDSSAIQTIHFYPENNNKFLVKTANDIYSLDHKKMSLTPLHLDEIGYFTERDGEMIFSRGIKAYVYNLNSGSPEPLALAKENNSKIINIGVSPSDRYLSFLSEDGTLQIFDEDAQSAKIIARNAKSSAFSPDSKKIAFLSGNKEIVIYNLTADEQELKNKRQKQTIILNIGATENTLFNWHKDSHYLFVKYPDALYLLEGDAFPPINFQLIDSSNQKYAYHPETEVLYLLKNNSLYSIIF